MRTPSTATLSRLHALAEMKKDHELARFSKIAQSKSRLERAVSSLKRTEGPLSEAHGPADPAMLRAALAHRRWTEANLRRLNQQLALVTSDYLRQKPNAAKSFGRAEVLSKLSSDAVAAQRARRDKA